MFVCSCAFILWHVYLEVKFQHKWKAYYTFWETAQPFSRLCRTAPPHSWQHRSWQRQRVHLLTGWQWLCGHPSESEEETIVLYLSFLFPKCLVIASILICTQLSRTVVTVWWVSTHKMLISQHPRGRKTMTHGCDSSSRGLTSVPLFILTPGLCCLDQFCFVVSFGRWKHKSSNCPFTSSHASFNVHLNFMQKRSGNFDSSHVG